MQTHISDNLNTIKKIPKNTRKITGTGIGFPAVDNRLGGLQNGEIVVVASRPGIGKTSFVCNIARNMAYKKNNKIVLFSLQNTREKLVNCKLLSDSKNSNLIIEDTSDILIKEICRKCKELKEKENLACIIIDSFQLIKMYRNLQKDIHDISMSVYDLKYMAWELQIPIIVTIQLNGDSIEKRIDKRPMVCDMYELGHFSVICKYMDVVLFLYREDYYNENTEEKDVMEVITAIQKNGPVGIDRLTWIEEEKSYK